ncbi:MAG: DUF4238 domain-containing protein [Alphaproteobacteria bacterium]|nr:DUF4238 domain-containing protein [Alphaproteobacteria bacterium]
MRHHFVPQFLLGAWSEGSGDEKFQEFRVDLDGIPTYRRVKKATAYQDNLYALTKPEIAGMSQHAVETHLLRHIDNYAARVRTRMLQNGLKSLSLAERCDWVRFIMSMRLRQPDIVHKLKTESADHLRRTLATQPEKYQALAEDDDAPTLEEWADDKFPGLIENFGLSFFHELVDKEEIGTKILHLHWWLWDFTGTKHDILLADNPCIFTGAIDEPELIVALPISPSNAFLATRGDQTANMLRQLNPSTLATRLNESSVLQARARIYARNTAPRRFIENRMKARVS